MYKKLETYDEMKELKSGKKIKTNKIERDGKVFINYIQLKDGTIHTSKEEIKKGDK